MAHGFAAGPVIQFQQRGVATLVTALTILMLSTLVSFSLAQAVAMERRSANNEVRAQQAFAAAEAGISAALAYLGGEPDRDDDGHLDPVFDTNADGVGDTNAASVGAGGVELVLEDLSGGALTRIRLTARGFSDDRSARRTLTQTVLTLNPLPNAPMTPLTSGGGVVIAGAATLRNAQGHATLWSGAGLHVEASASLQTHVANPGAPDYPDCIALPSTCELVLASSGVAPGADIVDGDTALESLAADAFFTNVFGHDPATFEAALVTLATTPLEFHSVSELLGREVVWVQGDTELRDSTLGCTVRISGNEPCPDARRKPVLVIVDGDATLAGTSHIYGLLYTTGSLKVRGMATVHGAVVAAGAVVVAASGDLVLDFDAGILAELARAGVTTLQAGSWKDF